MKEFDKIAAQGDIMLIRVDKMPEGIVTAKPREDGKYVVAHSETGHHHVLEPKVATLYDVPDDEFVGYIEVKGLPEGLGAEPGADLVHEKNYHTHETLRLAPGQYEVRRQREYTPEGWRRAAD